MPLEDETVLVAQAQTKGRGQMQNVWHSEAGKSLTFSIYKRFEHVYASSQFAISMSVSLAIKDALECLEIPNVTIKWPNDIMAGDKKCGGILIENELRGEIIKASIIGIGLNVNEATFNALPNATSLHIETQSIFDINQVLSLIAEKVLAYLINMKHISTEKIKHQYESELYLKGVTKLYKTPNDSFFQGKITGVLLTGELCIEREDGSVAFYNNKEVVFL